MEKGCAEEIREQNTEVYFRKEPTGKYIAVFGRDSVEIFERFIVRIQFGNKDLKMERFECIEHVGFVEDQEFIESPFHFLNTSAMGKWVNDYPFSDVWMRINEGKTKTMLGASRRFNAVAHFEKWHPEHIPYIKKAKKRQMKEEKELT